MDLQFPALSSLFPWTTSRCPKMSLQMTVKSPCVLTSQIFQTGVFAHLAFKNLLKFWGGFILTLLWNCGILVLLCLPKAKDICAPFPLGWACHSLEFGLLGHLWPQISNAVRKNYDLCILSAFLYFYNESKVLHFKLKWNSKTIFNL